MLNITMNLIFARWLMGAMPELWRPVVGWEGLYEVSSYGKVRSLDRTVRMPTRWGVETTRTISGRVLSPGSDGHGYLQVNLSSDGRTRMKKCHILVAEAFISPRPVGMHVLHWDDVKTHNHMTNLRYGTDSENRRDSIRNGTYRNANWGKTSCLRGHSLADERNLDRFKHYRSCRACALACGNNRSCRRRGKPERDLQRLSDEYYARIMGADNVAA